MQTYTLAPRDLLFLRDARPMAASDAGLGANWPRPDQLWFAILHAFHRQWPDRQDWEGAAHVKRDKERTESSDRFGALKTSGPFPLVQPGPANPRPGVHFPCPLDLDMTLVPCEGTDLPAPLTHTFRATKVGKQAPRRWLSSDDYQAYLRGAGIESMGEGSTLCDAERNIGIAIDPETHGTVERKLYQAEYLRLQPGVSLVLEASCDIHPKGQPKGTTIDVFGKFGTPTDLILGGQQGMAKLELAAGIESIPWPSGPITSHILRWTLLSPALFPAMGSHHGGWLPSWVEHTAGTVLLPKGDATRLEGEDRRAWRERVKAMPTFSAKVIAARIGKPLAFSGWDLQTGPKPTQLAVPAGSSYVFDCATVEEARALAVALHGRPRSSIFGEKGFGLGVCSSLPDPST